jgi:predicted DsbA family dithiol-disulfide isomerase
MSNSTVLEVFTDFVCPWCYLATPRVKKLQQNFDVDVQWVYFPLHPETPLEGMTLKDLFAGRPFDLDAAHARLKGLMDVEGLVFNPERTHTYNSLRDALYKAYFVDTRNVGDVEVLVEVAASCGISADAARRVLSERTFKEAVDADWARARRYGITGVPSFVAGNQKLVGAHPYEMLEKLVVAGGAKPAG